MPTNQQLNAGYTHRISWLEFHPMFGIYVPKSFPTTADAVGLHMESLRQRQAESDEDDIISIHCEALQ